MSAAQAQRLPQAWREGIADGLRGAGRDWLFAVKGAAAMLVTAWLAMYFQLQLPASAMMTVAIVMHPQSGTVLAKAFYRALGTVVGSLVGLLLVALFPQQHLLFLLAIALWIGLCAAGASLYRNFKSYAFVLAGYTAALVAMPVIETPDQTFLSAAMRVSEVMLGLLVAGVVSDVIFPQRLRDVLRQTLRRQFAGFVGFAADSVGGVLDRSTLENLHLRVVREVVQIESLRSSVVFEHAGMQQRNPRLKRLNHSFMVAATTYQSLHHLMNRLQGKTRAPVREALLELFEPVAAALRECMAVERMRDRALALEQHMAALEPVLAQAVRVHETRLDGHDARLDYASGVELLTRFVRELGEYAEAYLALFAPTGDPPAQQPHRFTHASDLAGAGLAAVRSIAVIGGMGAFWYFSAAPFGAWALLLAAIFSSLLSAVPNPIAATRNMALGSTAGIMAAFVLQFAILPRMEGFLLWAACLLPFLLIGFYLYTRPGLAALGTGFVLILSLMLMPVDAMNFAASGFFSNALSQLVGIFAALVGFIVFAGVYGSRWLQSRLRRRLLRQVVRACREPLDGLLGRFESASRDVLIQIAGLTPPDSKASRKLMAGALSVQEIGRVLIELRQDLAQAGVRSPLSARAFAAVAALYEDPDAPRYRAALDSVTAAIDTTPRDAREMPHLHLIRLALLDAGSVLSAYVGRGEPFAEELSYAA